MSECLKCGAPIVFVQRWTGGWVACDPEPWDGARESFVEVELENFVSVFRHDCQPKPPTPKFKPINQVYKGSKQWRSPSVKNHASSVDLGRQLELDILTPKK